MPRPDHGLRWKAPSFFLCMHIQIAENIDRHMDLRKLREYSSLEHSDHLYAGTIPQFSLLRTIYPHENRIPTHSLTALPQDIVHDVTSKTDTSSSSAVCVPMFPRAQHSKVDPYLSIIAHLYSRNSASAVTGVSSLPDKHIQGYARYVGDRIARLL